MRQPANNPISIIARTRKCSSCEIFECSRHVTLLFNYGIPYMKRVFLNAQRKCKDSPGNFPNSRGPIRNVTIATSAGGTAIRNRVRRKQEKLGNYAQPFRTTCSFQIFQNCYKMLVIGILSYPIPPTLSLHYIQNIFKLYSQLINFISI
ncbi:hypothetical protein PUN28_012039 [Cardiocondyla obscurior]|uniref:Uncharacterized protein n=1 Tax=Cardiocondyla obscurior TaxID=286306 RepID=A0AAW2FA98_9HYME